MHFRISPFRLQHGITARYAGLQTGKQLFRQFPLRFGTGKGARTEHRGNRLIWLSDIHLLLKKMSRDELDVFARFAQRKRLKAICRDALTVTQECFGTPIPRNLLDRLEPEQAPEPSACYLHSGATGIMTAEFRAIPGARNKLRYLREFTLPPPRYLLRKYDKSHTAWLPFLYCRRGAEGLGKVVSRILSGCRARF